MSLLVCVFLLQTTYLLHFYFVVVFADKVIFYLIIFALVNLNKVDR